MKTYTDYVELSAPCSIAHAALCDPKTWETLPLNAQCLGEMWRSGDELYTVRVDSVNPGGAAPTVCWDIAPVAVAGTRYTVALTLHDAVVSTHVAIAITATTPHRVLPFWWRRRLRATVRACVAALSVVLRERVADALTLEPVATMVSEQVAVGATTDSASDAALYQPDPRPHTNGTEQSSALASDLHARYPHTVEHFAAMHALDDLERVWRLEQGWQHIADGVYNSDVHQVDPRLALADFDYDLIYAGGGLGLLHATVMAHCYGYRVLLFDRSEVGCAHREWNISRRELQALVDLGIVTWDDLAGVVMREYRDGVVRFHNGPQSDVPTVEMWLPEVLNVALDAGALLQLMRRTFEAAGGTVLDHRSFRTVRVCSAAPMGVEIELTHIHQSTAPERYTARLLLDGMGTTSPLALLRHAGHPFAGVCPTVGTVARGFAPGDGPQEFNPELGDILVSVADAQRGEQLMWEGFPGRGDDLTVYLFYYATVGNREQRRNKPYLEPVEGRSWDSAAGRQPANTHPYSLLELFEQYFALLPTYKQFGPDFEHLKPVYGYIPGRHSMRVQEAPLLCGVLAVGDAAAQQSPLTFCGFGSHVRNLQRTTSLLDYALRRDLLEPEQLQHITAFQANVSLNWVFSRFMHPWAHPNDVNRLQNIFLAVLQNLGVDVATRYFQDRMRWSDYHPMILGVLGRYRSILLVALNVLGPRGVAQWASDYLRFSATAALAAAARLAGPRVEHVLVGLTDRVAPAASMAVRAAYAEWRSMGWIAERREY